MNVASWYALFQTTKKQLIHGVFTWQLKIAFIILNNKHSATHAFFSY